ncbi:putative C-mannosyltransferase DPY19L3 [Liparis tanakae]|uniref:Putative C-mannosyltransferase DPY19L3 n=1 Tax=Liparis tanakae TaxID=230148 RepID=A0A4Z2GYP5_9TELE|nr:putative C-mannosyltransferase DPY19L3 [Liparis tanakae]
MELRKRVKLGKLQHHPGPPRDAATEGRCGSNAMLGMERSGPGEASQLGRPGAHSCPGILPWRRCFSVATGLSLAGLVALTQAWCVNAIHENLLWFSQLTEVEREISFRTECGLYYSYYKQMLQAPSIQEGRQASPLVQDGGGQRVRSSLNDKEVKVRTHDPTHQEEEVEVETHPLDPGVLQHLAGAQTVLGVPNQKSGDEVFGAGGDVSPVLLRERVLPLLDALKQRVLEQTRPG